VVAGPSVILADPTDLVALPALGLAAWTAVRAERAAHGRRATSLGVLVVLPAAVIALAATSAPVYPSAVAVYASGSTIFVGEGNGYGGHAPAPTIWSVSEDGGRTWRSAARADVDALSARDGFPRLGCEPDVPAHCYRAVRGHLRVEETTDGTSWRVAWQITDRERVRLGRAYEGDVDVDRDLSSVALAVAPVPGGHVVVVANGRDGYVVRDAGGGWSRIGFGVTVHDSGNTADHPAPAVPPASFADYAPDVAGGLLAGLLVLAVGGSAAAWRTDRRPVYVFTPFLVVGALLLMSGAVWMHDRGGSIAPVFFTVELVAPPVVTIGGLFAVLGAVGILVGAVVVKALPGRRAGQVALIGLATAGATGALLAGVPGSHRIMALIAGAVAAVAALLAGRLGRRHSLK